MLSTAIEVHFFTTDVLVDDCRIRVNCANVKHVVKVCRNVDHDRYPTVCR
jgi:hypothetical protein